HLAAAESSSGIVFLHEVRPGPASRSYGIQVAQRAGIPAPVIRHASRELSRLEASGAATPQLDLFGAAADDDRQQVPGDASTPESAGWDMDEIETALELRDTLREMDPDSLTPRQALDLLYALHEGTRT